MKLYDIYNFIFLFFEERRNLLIMSIKQNNHDKINKLSEM